MSQNGYIKKWGVKLTLIIVLFCFYNVSVFLFSFCTYTVILLDPGGNSCGFAAAKEDLNELTNLPSPGYTYYRYWQFRLWTALSSNTVDSSCTEAVACSCCHLFAAEGGRKLQQQQRRNFTAVESQTAGRARWLRHLLQSCVRTFVVLSCGADVHPLLTLSTAH